MERSSESSSEVVPPADLGGTTADGADHGDVGERGDRVVDGTAATPSRPLELVSAVVTLLATGALVFLARAIEVRRETDGIDPRWWPELLGLIGLALAVVLLVVAAVRPPARRGDIERVTRKGWVRLVATVALTTVFLALWPVTGFVVVAPFFLCAVTYLFGGRGWAPLVLYPVVLPGLVYLLFHTLLKVPL